jgi:hypothetical protein
LTVLFWSALACAQAGNLDVIGVTLLRQIDPTLNGNAVKVAQAEAPYLSTTQPYAFEVNPAVVGKPVTQFTYLSSLGKATTFTNKVGLESGHADSVGGNFYGLSGGVATNTAHVDNYEANYFYNSIVAGSVALANSERVVNQSFIFGSQDSTVDQSYDNYAASKNVLFVSGAGNSGPISSPATCYNGLGVAVSDGSSSFGPTTNGGRSKPDITAPGEATSFSTPYVSGAAAVLLQAATRGDGGANVSAAGDSRTLKALLLNGAVKPGDWTNSIIRPLDARYGAGVLNVFNSWKQLGGGQHAFIESTTNASGGAHPPGTNRNNEAVLVGWDFNSIANPTSGGTYKERVNHYYFNLATNAGCTFTLTATLVWNRQNGKSAINNLNLFLYDAGASKLITCCTSTVDNIEHIFLKSLPQGRYDLQVQKSPVGQVTASETYALAFEFFNVSLGISVANNAILLSWPVAPAGFNLWSASSLAPPMAWTPVTAFVAVSNNQNWVSLPASAGSQFFRLQRP